MESLWLVPIILLFAYVDAWYFIRFFVLRLQITIRVKSKGRRKFTSTPQSIFSPYDVNGIVLPSDLDFMLHMNNSKYLREMDFGRVGMVVERGLHRVIHAIGGTAALAACSVRYRRSLTLFQRFVLRTRLLCWDEGAFYVEQRMLRKSDGFVCAINLAKVTIRGTTAPAVVKTWVGESVESPPFPPEVVSWCEGIAASSKSLLKERRTICH